MPIVLQITHTRALEMASLTSDSSSSGSDNVNAGNMLLVGDGEKRGNERAFPLYPVFLFWPAHRCHRVPVWPDLRFLASSAAQAFIHSRSPACCHVTPYTPRVAETPRVQGLKFSQRISSVLCKACDLVTSAQRARHGNWSRHEINCVSSS